MTFVLPITVSITVLITPQALARHSTAGLTLDVYGRANDVRMTRAIEDWRQHYNTERPHSRLGYLSPEDYIKHQKVSS